MTSAAFPNTSAFDAPAFAEARMPSRPRRRILISAGAVSPDRGSEPGVGWNVCSRLAKYHDITVLTDPGRGDEYRIEIDRYLNSQEKIPGLNFHYVDSRLSRWLRRESGPMRALYYFGYGSWQRALFAEATRLHAEQPFDLVHHLNFIGYREPGYLWSMGVPFVWGPVGGAENIPAAYFKLLTWRDRAVYGVRNLLNEFQKRCMRRPRRAAAAAKRIWAVSEETQRMVTERWGRSADLLVETGATPLASAVARTYDGTRPMRLIWSGQHIGRKGLPILLHAMAQLKGNSELLVLGGGPDTGAWQALSRRLGLEKRVSWAGHLDHESAVAEMAKADCMPFTGLKEGTPHVVLEALSLGLPVICHDACGMGVVVDKTCGIKIPEDGPEASIRGFAQSIAALIEDPNRLRTLSAGAIRRSHELTWDEKARQIALAYEDVLATEEQTLAQRERNASAA